MKYAGILLISLLLAACGRAPQAGVERGSPSPSAPVQLSYELPDEVAAGQHLTIDLALTTPLTSGELDVAVTGQQGVTLLGSAGSRVDLALNPQRPIALHLDVLPGPADGERYLILEVSIETAMGPQSRMFRITLPGGSRPADEGAVDSDGLKILPAERPR